MSVRIASVLFARLLMLPSVEASIQAQLKTSEDTAYLNRDLISVGLEWTGTHFRQLYPEKPLHLIFPPGYLTDEAHESFIALSPLPHFYRWGGMAPVKKASGKTIQLHHILTLDPVPEGLGIQSLKRLTLVADFDEIVDERTDAFFRHDENGNPTMIKRKSIWRNEEENETYEEDESEHVPCESPFKECRIQLSDQGERYRYQNWAYTENNFRLGGRPHFVQDYHYPKCCDCKKRMTFLMQMDYDIPQDNGMEWSWGSGGIGYMYWCDHCRVSSICWFCT